MSQNIKNVVNTTTEQKENKHKFFTLIMYRDTEDNIVLLENVKNKLKCESCKDYFKNSHIIIDHDNDVYDEDTFDEHFRLLGKKGELKKPHTHLYIMTNTEFTTSDFCKKLGIKYNSYTVKTPKPSSFESCIVYSIHLNSPTKYQYARTLIDTNIKEYVDYVLDNYNCYYNPLTFCIQYLNMDIHKDKKVSFKTFLTDYVSSEFCDYKSLQKNYSMIRDMINEHNREIKDVVIPMANAAIRAADRAEVKALALNEELRTNAASMHNKLIDLADQWGAATFIDSEKNKKYLVSSYDYDKEHKKALKKAERS